MKTSHFESGIAQRAEITAWMRDDPTVLLQYSVSQDWETKIKRTAKRIRENFPNAAILIYVTNQQIGANADTLKKELRNKSKLVLDLHDRGWFVERFSGSPEREKPAQQLVADVVDPYLESRGIVESKSPALSEFEAKIAVLQLQLQWEDDSRDKGLTKLSFEALVKSVLRGTSSENRVTRKFVRESIRRLLPGHAIESIDSHVDSALERLDKRAVRHWRPSDEVCLTHDEVIRVKDGLARKEMKDLALQREIQRALGDYFGQPLSPHDATALHSRTRRILDLFLLRKGEEFAAAVAQNRSVLLTGDSLDVLVTNDFGTNPDTTKLGSEAVAAVRLALMEVLQRSSVVVQQYLREIADGYTLFGFLRAVPDVQKTVQKIFRDGEIWLDTSVLLPVMAETLLSEQEQIVSRLLRGASIAGIGLRVTSGVIEELERHVNRCITYVRGQTGSWVGGVPFLYAMFALSGRSPEAFATWVENFCGKQRPKDDIAEYLLKEWQVKVEDLDKLVEEAPRELRWEVERIWREAHEVRRKSGLVEFDSYVIDRLVKHDVECFLGVLGKRKSTSAGDLGYVHWWLTFDKTVRDFEQQLKKSLGASAPSAPVISPDFLANYVAMGPVRAHVSKDTESMLPVAMFEMLPDHIPAELLAIAEEIRKESGAVDERLLRRKLRDALDELKRKRGELSKGGFTAVREKLERALKARFVA